MTDNERSAIKAAVVEAVKESGVLTADEIKIIVAKTVRTTLLESGINPDDWKENVADLRFTREWRQNTDKIKEKGLLTAVALVVAAVIGALWLGFKAALKHP